MLRCFFWGGGEHPHNIMLSPGAAHVALTFSLDDELGKKASFNLAQQGNIAMQMLCPQLILEGPNLCSLSPPPFIYPTFERALSVEPCTLVAWVTWGS